MTQIARAIWLGVSVEIRKICPVPQWGSNKALNQAAGPERYSAGNKWEMVSLGRKR